MLNLPTLIFFILHIIICKSHTTEKTPLKSHNIINRNIVPVSVWLSWTTRQFCPQINVFYWVQIVMDWKCKTYKAVFKHKSETSLRGEKNDLRKNWTKFYYLNTFGQFCFYLVSLFCFLCQLLWVLVVYWCIVYMTVPVLFLLFSFFLSSTDLSTNTLVQGWLFYLQSKQINK